MPAQTTDGPAAKRQKLDVAAKKTQPRKSRIFTPFRTLGLVSPTEVPFSYNKSNFQITTSVGRSLLTFSIARGLDRLWITRPETPAPITASTSSSKATIAAYGDPRKGEPQGLLVFQRADEVGRFETPRDLDEPIRQILVYGDWLITAAFSRVDVFKSQTLEHYTSLFPLGSKQNNEITGGICTVPTWRNNIFLGRKTGLVELWNVQTGNLIHTFISPSDGCGAVTCLEPPPSPTLLAIAYANGQVVIRDVRHDLDIIDLVAGTEDAPVTSIAFRTDGKGAGEDGRKDGVMATSSKASGDITFWDLTDGGRLSGVLRGAHNPPSVRGGEVRGGINKIQFLPGQNVIISSGLDNSLKTWISDQTPFSPIPRILHSRSGHAGQINCLQWLQSDFDGPEAGKKWLLTGSQDRSLWGWSLRRDAQSSELSQGNIRKKARKYGLLSVSLSGQAPTTALEDLKAPEITCIASSLNRDGGIGALPGKIEVWQKGNHKSRSSKAKDKGTSEVETALNTGWESVVTGHKGDSYARTWFWGRRRAGRWAFQTSDKMNVSSVAVTTCGTFAVIGSEGGCIDMYNLQSGLHRHKFPSSLTPAQARDVKMRQLKQADAVSKLRGGTTSAYPPGVGRHTAPVTGIVVSPVHDWVASCSLDGKVKFWDFLTGNLVREIDWGTGITGLRFHAGTELIAFSCLDNVIRLVDVATMNVVRQFKGCKAQINDFCWSHDGRWIVACAADRTVRTWDLPTGNMVDGFRVEKPCTAIALAESNEYLAAAVEGEVGVSLWVNKAFFKKQAPTRLIKEEDISEISGPKSTGTAAEVNKMLEGTKDDTSSEEESEDDEAPLGDLDAINEDLMRLSLVPKSKWQTLLHLDEIKARNKPIEPPKQPEKAPFFLPSTLASKDARGDGESAFADTRAMSSNNAGAVDGAAGLLEHQQRGSLSLMPLLRQCVRTGDFEPYITRLKSLSPSDADLEISSLSSTPSPFHDKNSSGGNDLADFLTALTARRREKKDFEMIEVWMKVFMRSHGDEIARDGATREAFAGWLEESRRSWGELDGMVSFCTVAYGWFMNPEA